MTNNGAPNYYQLVDIHDREFQKYSIDNGIYYTPVDEREEKRLDHEHRLLYHLFDDKMFFPPLEYPLRTLDCGYGAGNWASDMAQIYTQSEVTAIDIYPADLPSEHENLERQIWNLNDPLVPTYERDYYDLIHSRCVGPGIKTERWPGYLRDLRRMLRRDGWLQVAEYHYNFQSGSGSLTDQHALTKWGAAYMGVMQRDLNRNPTVGSSLEGRLRDAGLHSVRGRYFEVPIGPWPTDERQRRIGEWNLENIDALLDSHAIWPLTARLGWSAQQVKWLTDEAKQEIRNVSFKLYMRMYVAWGRKR